MSPPGGGTGGLDWRVATVPPPLGAHLADVDTPALVIDLEAFERNLVRMAEWSRQTGCAVRPHAKAHKTPLIARKQLDAGAIGITCSKLGEAEVLVAGGIGGILISSEVVGPAKVSRLISLARHADLIVVVDDLANARDLSDAAVAAGLQLRVLVEVDVGQNRCGVQPGTPAADLAARLAALPGLRFAGLQGYEGHLQSVVTLDERRTRCLAAMERLLETRRILETRGLVAPIVSTAGTGTHAFAGPLDGVTEVQPGSYIFMDCAYRRLEAIPYESSLSVLTTVVSRQRGGDVIVDAGYKSLSTDGGMPVPRDRPELTYAPAGDEHGRISGEALPAPGDKLAIVPSHCDTTVNLYDQFVAVRAGRVEAVWQIPGRGRVQ